MMSERKLIKFWGQGLVMFLLNKKNMEVDLTENNKYILADSKNMMNKKYIIDIQVRNFHTKQTGETKDDVYNYNKIDKLEENAKKENRIPIVAFVFVEDDNNKTIRVFLIELSKLKSLKNSEVLYVNEGLAETNRGIRFKGNSKYLNDILKNSDIDYTELIVSYPNPFTNEISFIN